MHFQALLRLSDRLFPIFFRVISTRPSLVMSTIVVFTISFFARDFKCSIRISQFLLIHINKINDNNSREISYLNLLAQLVCGFKISFLMQKPRLLPCSFALATFLPELTSMTESASSLFDNKIST